MSDLDPLDFGLVDPAVHPDPDACPTWARLRAECPVAWVEPRDGRRGFWVLTKYHDIGAVYRNSAQLSSARGNMLSTLLHGGDSASGRMLVVTDPPRHTEVRRVLQQGFSARAMRPIEESLRVAAEQLVSRAVEREVCEFSSEVAAQIPLLAVCELLAVPRSDRNRMLEMTMAAMHDDGSPAAAESAAAARRDILLYYAELLPQRRRVPAEDVVSLLASAVVDGKRLSDAEVLLNCYNIIIGGDETTRLSAVGGVLALAEHRAEWDELKDTGAVDAATEEILRWTTPATHIGRVAIDDVTVRGRHIARGDAVTLWNVSANRDGEVFDEPFSFDVSRAPNAHLTLGHGRHFCLGGPLARVELQVLLRALLGRVARIELAGPPSRLRSTFLAGVSELPVRLVA